MEKRLAFNYKPVAHLYYWKICPQPCKTHHLRSLDISYFLYNSQICPFSCIPQYYFL